MSHINAIAHVRMRSAIFVAAKDRVDQCEFCVYINISQAGCWCRLHSSPTSKGSICAAWELRQPRAKAIPCGPAA